MRNPALALVLSVRYVTTREAWDRMLVLGGNRLLDIEHWCSLIPPVGIGNWQTVIEL
jgi:hypothetical protein